MFLGAQWTIIQHWFRRQAIIWTSAGLLFEPMMIRLPTHIFASRGLSQLIRQLLHRHWGKHLTDRVAFPKNVVKRTPWHYIDVIMIMMPSQITSLTVVYSTVCSDADQSKHQSSASLAFVWGIHWDRWIPRTKGQLREKCFHLMTSSWIQEVGTRQSHSEHNLAHILRSILYRTEIL